MPVDYSLLPTPGAGAHGHTPIKRAQLFLRRRPLITSFVSLMLFLAVYVSIFPSHPAQLSSAVGSSWSSSAKTGSSGSWDPDDDDGWFSKISGSGSKSSLAVDRQKCEQLWQDDGRLATSGPPPTSGSGGVTEGSSSSSSSSPGGVVSGPVDGGKAEYSLEEEIRKGKTRKEALKEMVAKTNGYYVRDYPLWLGWNNIRYIIEASLLHAELLDRVLVIPTNVVARACEFDKETCAAFAKMVNRGDAMQSDEWRSQPIEKQWAWLIPTELMINIPVIRKTRPIMTVADYLLVHDIDPSVEDVRGQWQRNGYHTTGAQLHVIPNGEYDNTVARVDRLPTELHLPTEQEKRVGDAKRLRDVLEGKMYSDWDEMQAHFGGGNMPVDELTKKLNDIGGSVLHTWQGSHGMEYVRTVTEPIIQVTLSENLRGYWDDYHKIDADVLLLEGETHYQRKPATLRFTTIAAQQDFARLVIYDILPPTMLGELAERLDDRMRARVGGRNWRAAHMRRGDFVMHEWVMNKDPYEHFNRIKTWMETARQTLIAIKKFGYVEKYPVPEATSSPEYLKYEPPTEDDDFYLATDERNATYIEHYKAHGAVLIQDLLTAQDRRDLDAWPLVFTDVLGVLEQTMLARASTFYGHALSSVSGGAVNHRATLGKDPRTTVID